MKILAGVLIEDDQGRILCGVRNKHEAPFYGYLATPWGRAEVGEDPYCTADREGHEELAGQNFMMTRVSACAPTGDGYTLYLFLAKPDGTIDLTRHSPEFSRLEWLTVDRIRSRGLVVPALLEILDTFNIQ
ncbi:MAG: NUDIX domain-containing protein [bacterium]|nr:NUDIX domain-containing protein [bacterium]